jgi:hypothetical protein
MRIRHACLVLGVWLVPALASADSHNADVYGGGSGGGGGSKLGGFIVALGKTQLQDLKSPKPVLWGGIGGASVQFGSHDGRDVTQIIWGAGPRFSFAKPGTMNFIHAQVQLVGVYTNDGRDIKDGDEKPNDFAVVVGTAYDHAFTRTQAGSTPHPGLGFRFQADRVFNMGDRENVWRLSAGLIYRIPRL